MPDKKGEASVYRTSNLSNLEIWGIGIEYVEKKRKDKKKLQARADIVVSHVLATGLHVTPDRKPHKRHANLTNWPSEKSEQMLIAMELANSSRLFVK